MAIKIYSSYYQQLINMIHWQALCFTHTLQFIHMSYPLSFKFGSMESQKVLTFSKLENHRCRVPVT